MDSLFFIFSKVLWFIVSPGHALIIGAVLSFACYRFGLTFIARCLGGAVASMVLLLCFFPIGEWLYYPLEAHYSPNPELPASIDGVIVLGGGEDINVHATWHVAAFTGAAERNIEFMGLVRRYPNARPVFTGGSGRLLGDTGSVPVVKQLYREQGLDVNSITFETESRNTYENAKFSQALVEPKPGEVWVLITSAFHMPRSVGIFNQLEWAVVPYPVDYRTEKGNLLRVSIGFAQNLNVFEQALREWIGLVAYRVSGKTKTLFP